MALQSELLGRLQHTAALLDGYRFKQHASPDQLEHLHSIVLDTIETLQQQAEGPQPLNLFRAIDESVNDFGVFALDLEGRVTTWNVGAQRIFGYSATELIGQSADVLFTPEDRASNVPAKERAQAAQVGRGDDKRWHLRKDASRFWADGVVTPLREGEAIVGFVKILRDATTQHLLEEERERLLQQLSAERSLLKTVLEHMPSGLAIAEAPSGKLLMHNHMAVRLLRHAMRESVDASGYHRYGAKHQDGRFYESDEYPIARALYGETVEQEEMLYQRGDGTLTYFAVNAAPALAPDGTIVAAISTFYDIAEQKRNHDERLRLLAAEQQARAEAEAAVQVRDAFLAIAAHELRTPLTALSGTAQLLQRRLERANLNDERLQAAAGAINNQASRLNRLIDSLFDVSRLQARAGQLVLAPLDLCTLTDEVVGEIAPLLDHHTIGLEYAVQPALIYGDALRLEQVLYNLLQNAIKYSPSGGAIRIRIAQSADTIDWSISDEGIGIPLTARKNLFERFYRAENATKLPISGMGIGLFVVHELVSLHGGTVEVASEEGQGTVFTVRLTQAAPTA